MEKITKEQLKVLLDKFVIEKSNIPEELLTTFKEKLTDVVLSIQKEVFEKFGGEEDISNSLIKFFDSARMRKENVHMESAGYTTVDIPIIVPIEVFALCCMFNKNLLPVGLSRISELYVNDIVNHVIHQTVNSLQEEFMLLNLMKSTDKLN